MQINPFTVYIWGNANNFCVLFIAAAVACIVTGIIICLTIACAYGNKSSYPSLYENLDPKEVDARRAPIAKRLIIVGAVCALLAALVPSSKTIALMVVVPAIINSEPIQKDLPEMYQMAKDALKETLKTK